MKIIADLQVHSRFARATSKDITLESLEKYARIKGLGLLGTADFQHPQWNKEIKKALREDDNGILWSKTGFPFIWQTEISLMYSQGGKGRAVHVLVYAPDTIIADRIISYLGSKGRLDYDGRPIFGMSVHDAVRDLKAISDDIEIIFAHCMTPFFGVYGSKSGFDSLKECLGDQADKVYAVESGMSADPGMLWRFKEQFNVVSFSDAHSMWPWRIGREATIFDVPKLTYRNVMHAIRTGDGLAGTIETPPAYGRYHWDGHRDCGFESSPEETKRLDGICPKCGKKLIIGVDYRVEELAKEPDGYRPRGAKPYYTLVPLHELIAFHLGTSLLSSKKVWAIYDALIHRFGTEFSILLDAKEDNLSAALHGDEALVRLIMLNREAKLPIRPGYDGVYGRINLPAGDPEGPRQEPDRGQKGLSGFLG